MNWDTEPDIAAPCVDADDWDSTTGTRHLLLGADGKPYESRNPGTLGGHRARRIYGRLDCPGALRAITNGGYVKNRVFFADEATAVAAGFRPCGTCLPALQLRRCVLVRRGRSERCGAPLGLAPGGKHRPYMGDRRNMRAAVFRPGHRRFAICTPLTRPHLTASG